MSTEIGLRALVAKWRAFADENDVYALDADSIGIASECVAAERKAKSLRTCADELESILAAPQAAPAGMVLVPREAWDYARQQIRSLAENGTRRIHDLGGECDPAEATYAPIFKRLDSLAAAPAAQVAEQNDAAGWVVADGQGKRWRFWGDTGPEWTTERDKALRFARRCDAEAFAREGEDAWLIQPIGQPAAAPAVVVDEAMVERACREYVGYDGDVRNSMRAALAAALNQGKANG